MELTGLVIAVALVILVWRESKADAVRRTAEAAIQACEEEIQSLRGAIMGGADREVWQRDKWERNRRDLLTALDYFHGARIGSKYDRDLVHRSIPSFQDESEWEKWRILARGPYASSVHPTRE